MSRSKPEGPSEPEWTWSPNGAKTLPGLKVPTKLFGREDTLPEELLSEIVPLPSRP